ncbi:hypothetical protein BDW75DRAFT_74297 [Aspergillus navahoensis]
MDALSRCERPMLLEFMVDAPLSQSGTPTKVRACSVWANNIPTLNNTATNESVAEMVPPFSASTCQITGNSRLAACGVSHIQTHLEKYVQPAGNTICFANIGQATFGSFGGRDVDVARTSEPILSDLVKHIIVDEVSHGLLEQICGPSRGARQIWGIVVAFNDTFYILQQAVKS